MGSRPPRPGRKRGAGRAARTVWREGEETFFFPRWLQPGTRATVAFLLRDDSVKSLRIVVQDPATDAELTRSASDIPVRLSI